MPGLGLAIEYQGVQHYEPIDLFGGADGLAKRQEMDDRKRAADNLAAGIRLIEWRYDEPVNVEAVRERIRVNPKTGPSQGGALQRSCGSSQLRTSNSSSRLDRRRGRAVLCLPWTSGRRY